MKWGILATGTIAKKFASTAAQMKAEGEQVVAVGSRRMESARAFGEAYGIPRCYDSYEALAADPEVEAVYVATPNTLHYENCRLCLEHGKHVLCEKPMAATPADAKKMLEARDRTGKMLTIGYQYRHFPENQVAKKVVDSGALGDVYYAEATYLRRRGVPTWGVFTDKAKQGGGPLIDIGTHALDLTLFLMNNYDVDYVCGTSFEKLGHTLDAKHQGQVNYRGEFDTWNNETYDVEDSAVGFIKMKNGATIVLRAAWAINMAEDYAANGEAYTMLAGTEGGLDTKEGRVRLNHVVAEYPTISWVGNKVRGFIPGFSQGPAPKSKEAEIWVKALKGEGELFVTADQAYVVTRILDAIYESNRTGKPVYFD